ncbi:hypothetical protein LJK88_00115 [Paenibacillus sp. P26]|nr:hypothetical protein LJK88_00115 [Paenibacillus sp. P26]UUZ91288.1 hypothetical protein LJK87_37260 [Paenibacillus sp. P25]
MQSNSQYYVIYDEYSISICTVLDDVFDALAGGSTLYGYTDDEEIAQLMLNECFNVIERK